MNLRSLIALMAAAGLLAALPSPTASAGAPPKAREAKKCKRRIAHRKRRCRRRPAALSISPPGHDFGTIGIADGAPQDFTVTNGGGRRSGIPSGSLSGPGARYFLIDATTCAAPLAPRASCTVTVGSTGNDGGTGIAQLDVSAIPGRTRSVALIVNLF